MFGGIVMGSVNIQGSIPLFYAGWLLTGQTVGRGGTGTPVNFNVDGDIQNLVTIGSIGTNTDSGLADLGAPNYTTGFNMHVGGRVGMVKTLDSFVGSIDVGNDPNAPGLAGLTFQQVDRRSDRGTIRFSLACRGLTIKFPGGAIPGSAQFQRRHRCFRDRLKVTQPSRTRRWIIMPFLFWRADDQHST